MTITIKNSKAGKVEIWMNDTIIGAVTDGKTMLTAIDRQLNATGFARVTGYSATDGNLVAGGIEIAA
jgi:hypothetical protein